MCYLNKLALPYSTLELLGSIKGSFIFLKGLEPPLLDHKPLDTNSRETHALLKIKVLRKVLEVVPMKNHFWLHQESSSQRFFKESSLSYLFVIWRTFFQHKGPFEKQKGSSDGKASLWNHLDKKKSYSMSSWSTFIVWSAIGPFTNP